MKRKRSDALRRVKRSSPFNRTGPQEFFHIKLVPVFIPFVTPIAVLIPKEFSSRIRQTKLYFLG